MHLPGVTALGAFSISSGVASGTSCTYESEVATPRSSREQLHTCSQRVTELDLIATHSRNDELLKQEG